MNCRVFSARTLLTAIVIAAVASAAFAATVTVQVTGSDGGGVVNVKVRYGTGSTYTTWWFGTTNAFGQETKNLAPGVYSFQALYNNGHQEVMSFNVPGDGTTVNFQTRKLTLRLQECDTDDPINGGRARFGADSSYWTSWFPGGTTGAGGTDGETHAEFFPGNYTFEMQYNGTAEVKPLAMPDANHTLTWDASKVTLQYSGGLSYGGPTGNSRWFNKPTMYLLAGTYTFHARTGGYFDLTISGCVVEKTINLLRLKDHNGDPLGGGKARGGNGASYAGWWVPGLTDPTLGVLVDVRNGLQTIMSYEMQLNNGAQQIISRDVSVNSIFNFQTSLVTLRLRDSGANPLNGGTSRYGSGGVVNTFWPDGPTGSSAPGETQAELFPGTYSFEMGFNHSTQVLLSQTVPGSITFDFQTSLVILRLLDNSLNPLNGGNPSYGTGANFGTWWWPGGLTGSGSNPAGESQAELFPGTFSFKMYHGAWSQTQLNQVMPGASPLTWTKP